MCQPGPSAGASRYGLPPHPVISPGAGGDQAGSDTAGTVLTEGAGLSFVHQLGRCMVTTHSLLGDGGDASPLNVRCGDVRAAHLVCSDVSVVSVLYGDVPVCCMVMISVIRRSVCRAAPQRRLLGVIMM